MTARATFTSPVLPLGGHDLHPDYIRLFGLIPPEQAITTAAPLLSGAAEPCGPSSALFRDPKDAAAGHFLPLLVATRHHPSLRSLADIAALRLRHVENGHDPATDAAHGWHFFKSKADQAYRDAIAARAPETRRKRLITAAAILVAQIDAEDFTLSQQEPAA